MRKRSEYDPNHCCNHEIQFVSLRSKRMWGRGGGPPKTFVILALEKLISNDSYYDKCISSLKIR